jgi:hypothetical protein
MKDPATTVEPHYTLRQAVAKFFPGGPLTVASLCNEIQKGRLRATMPAGKLLVTETAIAEMLEKWRVQASNHTSLASERHRESSSGSSETERIERAQAAASAVITRQRNESSPITSTTSTSHQKATSRSSTKSLRLISKTTPRGLQITTIPDRYREADFELGRGKKLSDVTGANRRKYVVWRTSQLYRGRQLSDQTARHDLKTLRAAIRWYKREHDSSIVVPLVTMPQQSPPRMDYWLARDEVARRIKMARKSDRTKHVARMLLIGVYTGTRPGAILGRRRLPSPSNGFFDLEARVLHRAGSRSTRSNKCQPPAKIHARLIPHLRRWSFADKAHGIASVIHLSRRARH